MQQIRTERQEQVRFQGNLVYSNSLQLLKKTELMKKQLLALFFGLFSIFAHSQISITDETINAGETYTMTSDQEYIIDGYVYVEAGATLIIEPGTVIRGRALPSNGNDLTSALIISRGAKIMAEGTAGRPIIFTSDLDDLSTTTDLTATDNNTWGGLVILGNSIVGEDGGTDVVEGLPSGTDDPRNVYGGDDVADNSGILKYVSIRHGGSDIGADNEINGLTLGGVGNGTVIDYIEIFANQDDGIEFFGGSVNVTHAVVSFVGDDSYDMDESWSGYIQFALALHGEENGQGDNAIEYDGSEDTDKDPNATGRIYNGTFIGAGANAANSKSKGLLLKQDGSAQIWNSIFVDQVGAVYTFTDAGAAAIAGNMAFGFQGDLVSGDQPATFDIEQTDPGLRGISRVPNNQLDPRTLFGANAASGAVATSEGVATTYRGAFDDVNWADSWTALSEYGYFGSLSASNGTPLPEVITDATINAGDNVVMLSGREYTIDGYVYVEEGACLTIEPGVIVRGRALPSNGNDLTSALIISRNATIKAVGTANNPIIFTSDLDDLSVTTDLTAEDNNTWGGLVILGNSIVGEDGGTDVVEGLPSGTDDPRNVYGGDDVADNSGILKYVSIRHGGSDIGADNEINGLTLGGVGNGTVIDYIEIFANQDDGIEFFGGSVNVTHAVVSFVGDDSYDMDESWSGYIQFALALHGEQNGQGDNAIEYDGSEDTDKDPNATGRIYNGTFIGAGANAANSKSKGLLLKQDGRAQIWNSIFVDQVGPVYTFTDAGAAAIAGNMAFGFQGDLVAGDQPATFDVVQINPFLGGISRVPNNGLDPRPKFGSNALGNAATTTEGEATTYRGAFKDTNWALGWTALDSYGYFGNFPDGTTSTVDFGEAANGLTLYAPSPNPIRNATATISFELPESSDVQIQVYDITGRVSNEFSLGRQPIGLSQYPLNVSNYANGTYVMVLITENASVSQKLVISK